MPCLKVTGIIVRNPDFTVRVFRHEYFHRKVDCDTGRSDHPGRSSLRVAKDQELGRAHLKTRLFGLTAVIDQSKKLDILCGECFFNPFHRLVYRVVARYRDDAVIRFWCHEVSFCRLRIQGPRLAHRNQIDRHRQAERRQKYRDSDRQRRGTVNRRTAALQLVNQANVVPRTEYVHGDAQHDQARAKPERGSVRARLKTRLAALQRLQEQTEASHHKPKAHQRQTCSDPSEEGSFCSQVVGWAAGRSVCHPLTISGCLQDRKRFALLFSCARIWSMTATQAADAAAYGAWFHSRNRDGNWHVKCVRSSSRLCQPQHTKGTVGCGR